jgi:alpha-L-rhamnosidase
MVYEVSIPANTTATVTLPAASLDNVSMNDAPLKNAASGKVSQNKNGVTLQLGSGNYRFSYTL